MIKISCEEYAKDRKESLKAEIGEHRNPAPYVTIIQTVPSPAADAYIAGKVKDAKEIGVNARVFRFEATNRHGDVDIILELPSSIPKNEGAQAFFEASNRHGDVDAIIVQMPSIISKEAICSIDPVKDVDGFSPNSMHTPATAKGIMGWLTANKVNLCGKTVTIIGRSDLVGKPLAKLMTEANATVTLCHSMTKDIRKHTKGADIVVSAVGKPRWLTRSYFNNSKEQIVIDVGISRVNGKLVGDVDPKVAGKVAYLTPVPKGVGLLTRVALMENIVKAWRKRISEDR